MSLLICLGIFMHFSDGTALQIFFGICLFTLMGSWVQIFRGNSRHSLKEDDKIIIFSDKITGLLIPKVKKNVKDFYQIPFLGTLIGTSVHFFSGTSLHWVLGTCFGKGLKFLRRSDEHCSIDDKLECLNRKFKENKILSYPKLILCPIIDNCQYSIISLLVCWCYCCFLTLPSLSS